MQLSYKILFIIEVLHDYYSNAACNDFIITPSPETQQLFRDRQILWRHNGNRLYALVRTIEGKPMASITPDLVFRCYLQLNRMQFPNYTNIEVNYNAGQRVYLTNLHQHNFSNTQYLTTPIDAYNASSAYVPGSLALHASGDVYEALRGSNNGNAHTLGETGYWSNRGQVRYATQKDLVTCASNIFRFPLETPADAAAIDVFRLNNVSGAYDAPALPSQLVNYEDDQSEVLISLGALTPGRYRVQVNGASMFVYVDSRIQPEQVFGVAEIFSHLDILNNDGTLKETVFTLRFLNRAAIWQYQLKAGSVITGIKDNNNEYTFTKTADTCTSDQPIPLSETPIRSFVAESGNAGPPGFPLRNASVERIKTLQRNGDIFYCSEIFLNQ